MVMWNIKDVSLACNRFLRFMLSTQSVYIIFNILSKFNRLTLQSVACKKYTRLLKSCRVLQALDQARTRVSKDFGLDINVWGKSVLSSDSNVTKGCS